MKHITFSQYKVLHSTGPTTLLRAARQLEQLGAVEITESNLVRVRRYNAKRLAVTVRVTEHGRELKAMARLWHGRAR
jgi:DNA-binding MarR family transcriptional regulator